MISCPEGKCNYKTQVRSRMEEHKRNTRHGYEKRAKESRAHLATRKKKSK